MATADRRFSDRWGMLKFSRFIVHDGLFGRPLREIAVKRVYCVSQTTRFLHQRHPKARGHGEQGSIGGERNGIAIVENKLKSCSSAGSRLVIVAFSRYSSGTSCLRTEGGLGVGELERWRFGFRYRCAGYGGLLNASLTSSGEWFDWQVDGNGYCGAAIGRSPRAGRFSD